MFEFGDDLVIDSYRIPWLIWIQLLTMLLLVILLYYLTTTPSDLSRHFSTASDSPSPFLNPAILTSAAAHTRFNLKAGETERKETGTSTSEVSARPEGRGGTESSSTKNEGSGKVFEHSPHHPCHIFGLAKLAFLKCLGIDSTKEKDD